MKAWTRRSHPLGGRALIALCLVIIASSVCLPTCAIVFPTSSITVNNESGQTIVAVCMAPTGDPEVGANRLPVPIQPGQSATLSEVPKDVYTLRFVFSNGSYKLMDQVDLTRVEILVLNVRYVEGGQ